MKNYPQRYAALLFVCVLTLCSLPMLVVAPNCMADTFFLSVEEARQLHLSEAEWDRPPMLTRGVSIGPRIDLQTPVLKDGTNPTLEAVSPLSLMVMFQENGAPVDMSSLEIIARKGFFSKSLTDRVKPFVEGTNIRASGLKVPKGKFRIEIVIADVQGNQTSSEYRLVVTN